MSILTILCCFTGILSLFVSYKVYCKIKNKSNDNNQKGIFGNLLLLIFINLIITSLYLFTFILSYSFFWEKAFRVSFEPIYNAEVVGYKEEIVKTQNFRGSTYYNKTIYFPKVKFLDSDGKEIIKVADITTNSPIAIGEKITITDSHSKKNINLLDSNWTMLLFGSIFTGLTSFFAVLLTSYLLNNSFKERIHLSGYFAMFFLFLNLLCVLLLYFKVNYSGTVS